MEFKDSLLYLQEHTELLFVCNLIKYWAYTWKWTKRVNHRQWWVYTILKICTRRDEIWTMNVQQDLMVETLQEIKKQQHSKTNTWTGFLWEHNTKMFNNNHWDNKDKTETSDMEVYIKNWRKTGYGNKRSAY